MTALVSLEAVLEILHAHIDKNNRYWLDAAQRKDEHDAVQCAYGTAMARDILASVKALPSPVSKPETERGGAIEPGAVDDQTEIERGWSLENCIDDEVNEGLHPGAALRLRLELAALRAKAALADEINGATFDDAAFGEPSYFKDWQSRYRWLSEPSRVEQVP